MLGSGLDDEGTGADEALEVGALLEGDGAGAVDLAPDVTVDVGRHGGDRVQKFNPRAFFHPQVPAVHLADDFSVAADDEITRAID